MVNPDGILPDPLCLRRFVGPEKPVGDAGLDKFRGVRVADVTEDGPAEGTANEFDEAVIGKLGLKSCCSPCRSVVENDCLNIFEPSV